MKQIPVEDTGSLSDYLAGGLAPEDRLGITDGADVIAVVLPAVTVQALEDTAVLLATTGALASIAEGLADLAASRADDWRTLRADYGRGSSDDQTPEGKPPAVISHTVISHTARWDLELLPPPVAQQCFDLLDSTRLHEACGLPMHAGFDGLRLLVEHGYRVVYRQDDVDVEVLHVDVAPS